MRHRTRPAHGRALAVAGGAAALVLLAATGAHAEGKGDVRVTKAVVNGGTNWETLKYKGFTGQSVQLQFKKSGATRYTTVKTVKTGSAGKLGAKVTATAAGSWRWYFPGTTTTARVTSAGDTVTLK